MNMTRKEYVEKLFGTKIFTKSTGIEVEKGCQGFKCMNDWCEGCNYAGFWNEEVSLAELYANLSTSDAGKAILKGLLNSAYGKPTIKYLDTDSIEDIREAFKNGCTHAVLANYEPAIKFIDNWVEVPSTLMGEDVNYIAEILDDATVHGLDFKYENGKFYFKDRHVSINMDTQDVD